MHIAPGGVPMSASAKPLDDNRGEPREEPRRAIRPFPPRYRAAALAPGVVTGAALWLMVGLPFEVAAAAGALRRVRAPD